MRLVWYHYYTVDSNEKLTNSIRVIKLSAKHEPLRYAEAGQFVMVYLPNVGELPLSVYAQTRSELSFIVEDFGGFSSNAIALKSGDIVGVRGPFGRGFTKRPGIHYLIVAGGSGAPPLLNFMNQARGLPKTRFTYILGARSSEELFLLDEAERMGALVKTATDDGSCGFRGYVTDLAEEIIKAQPVDAMYACGPEPMLLTALQVSKKHDLYFEASFVRDVRCAMGVCGLCVMNGTGKLLCTDGPVFTREELAKLGV
jgi:dihydroorotate dehydrogenase electron transfer subunit